MENLDLNRSADVALVVPHRRPADRPRTTDEVHATHREAGERRSWAAQLAPEAVWAIEGSNFLGRRLALALVDAGADVRDVCPTRTSERRRRRPSRGKSDAVDAEAIARELLAHPDLPHAFKTTAPGRPEPAREALAVVLRTRHQVVDHHRRLLNEADVLLPVVC